MSISISTPRFLLTAHARANNSRAGLVGWAPGPGPGWVMFHCTVNVNVDSLLVSVGSLLVNVKNPPHQGKYYSLSHTATTTYDTTRLDRWE